MFSVHIIPRVVLFLLLNRGGFGINFCSYISVVRLYLSHVAWPISCIAWCGEFNSSVFTTELQYS